MHFDILPKKKSLAKQIKQMERSSWQFAERAQSEQHKPLPFRINKAKLQVTHTGGADWHVCHQATTASRTKHLCKFTKLGKKENVMVAIRLIL